MFTLSILTTFLKKKRKQFILRMNIGFSYEIIRDYLLREGGKVEYHKLIKHFKDALAENKGI